MRLVPNDIGSFSIGLRSDFPLRETRSSFEFGKMIRNVHKGEQARASIQSSGDDRLVLGGVEGACRVHHASAGFQEVHSSEKNPKLEPDDQCHSRRKLINGRME